MAHNNEDLMAHIRQISDARLQAVSFAEGMAAATYKDGVMYQLRWVQAMDALIELIYEELERRSK